MERIIETDFGTVRIKGVMIDAEFNMLEEGVDVWIDGEYQGNLIGVYTDDQEDEIIELVELNFK
tara:strand:- start:539 stop:730 length:192 start_codon:yes stop_codon:yes gene_type:complete